jgi:tetratricopeptide (TPR) repeat protein
MNLSRGWLSRGKPRPVAYAWSGGAGILLFLLLGGLTAHAVWQGPERASQALEADVLPGIAAPGAADLQLHTDNAAKADALAAFSQAIVAEDNADSDTALADYQKALALDPGYTELAVKVAYELARRGDPSAGVEVLKDSIKASPKAPLAYLYLSQLYANNLRKNDIGLKYAQQALDLDPTNFASYVAVFEIELALDQRAKADEVLDRAAKAPGTDADFSLQLGEFYVKLLGDEPVPADQVDKIATVFRKALAQDGNNPLTLQKAADFFLRAHKEKEAIPIYLKAIKLSPANPPDGDESLADMRDGLARCFESVGQTKEAIDTVKALIKENPLRPAAYDLLCGLYEKDHQIDAAVSMCQQLMLLKPDDYRNYVTEAALLMEEHKLDKAIQLLTDARTKFPDQVEVTYSLGLAYSEAKRFHEALAIFDQAVQEASVGGMDMLDSRFYFAYGAAAEQSGQVEKAAALLQKSIDLEPDPQDAGEAYNYLGYMWVDRGMKLDEGGDLIKKALKIEPANPAYVDSLGWYYFKKGDFKDAIETLKKAAASIQPEDATVDEHLGDAYAAANDMTHALDLWQRAAALDKDNKEITVKIAGARQKLAHEGPPANTTTP